MNNTRFAVMLGLLALIVFATMLIIRSYNPSREFQIAEQQELTEIAEIKSLLGEAYELIQINQFNAAEKKLHLLLRETPRNLIALQMLGNVYFIQKKYNEAEETFRTLTNIDPTRSINFNNLGQTLAMQGKYNEAVQELRKAINLSPDLAQPHLNLAEIYIKLNNKKAALEELQKALELEKNNNSISINLQAFQALKDEKEFQQLLNSYSKSEVKK